MFWNRKNKQEDNFSANDEVKTPRILMIEDDPSNYLLYKTAFQNLGFEVVIQSTADGDFASLVAQEKPDILSMDIMIGDRDGLEAIAVLKADERTKNIPIIILTNFSDEEKITRAKELGAVDYIRLQAHTIEEVPIIFRRFIDDPDNYVPVQPLMR